MPRDGDGGGGGGGGGARPNSYVSAHSLCRVYISRCERCPVNCVRRSGWDLTDCVSRDAEREDRLIGSMPLFLSLSLSPYHDRNTIPLPLLTYTGTAIRSNSIRTGFKSCS